MNNNLAIVVEDLSYQYHKLLAVNNISFNVKEGEILGFLGPNGAGKTTTVKILIGLLKPKTGRAFLLGKDISKHMKEIQGEIGVCFEVTNLYEQMSAVDNLTLFARLFGVKDYNPYEILKRVGLGGRERDRVEGYSKGMKQRLMIARAFVNRPKIIFLDEPTMGLDPVSSEEIRKIILEERDRGATIFLTTHDMWEADKLSDRVGFIDQGKIVALDTPLNLKQQYGKRALKANVRAENGEIVDKEILLDTNDTPSEVSKLFTNEKVITIHSKEATLEDIFIKITGRGLI